MFVDLDSFSTLWLFMAVLNMAQLLFLSCSFLLNASSFPCIKKQKKQQQISWKKNGSGGKESKSSENGAWVKTTTSVWKQLLWKLCLSCLSCGLFAIAHLCPTLGKTLAPTCRLCSSVLPCSSDSVNPDIVSLYSPCFGVTEPADNQVTWLINISVIPQKGVEREATYGRYGGWWGGSSWLSHKWLSSIIHLKQSRPAATTFTIGAPQLEARLHSEAFIVCTWQEPLMPAGWPEFFCAALIPLIKTTVSVYSCKFFLFFFFGSV